jgi:hypothetical protein
MKTTILAAEDQADSDFNVAPSATSDLVALRKWRESIGVSSTTTWRWITAGWLHPIRIANKLYLTRIDIQQFTRRASSGEFGVESSGVCAKEAA